MSLARTAIEKKVVTGFTTAVLLVGGMLAFTQLGQLEDPEFTVKTASIVTTYPGANDKVRGDPHKPPIYIIIGRSGFPGCREADAHALQQRATLHARVPPGVGSPSCLGCASTG